MLVGGTVLLVEDEEPVRQLACSQLESLGYRVAAVPTAWDALKLLSGSERFDLLFTDVVLPEGLSGIELAKRARRAFGPDLKVVLTSGYTGKDLPQLDCEEVTVLLRKPYRRAQLQVALNRALGRAATS
jgi:CheY-like chemotaxis protein